MAVEFLILLGGILLFLAVATSRIADTLGVPTLLLFLVLGMLAGSEGIGGLAFDSPEEAQQLGTVALMVILFSGGLDTRWSTIKPVLAPGLALSTLGVLLTALLVAVFAKVFLGTYTGFDIGPATGISWLEALLIAVIISSTDAAAVFSVFRTSPVQPRSRLRALLELESGSNDPMAVLLTVTVLGLIMGEQELDFELALLLVTQLTFGTLIGAAAGWVGSEIANRMRLSGDGLYPVLVFAFGAIAFGLSNSLGGNEYLAVYVAGVVIGNRVNRGRDTIMVFHEGLSWMMQIMLFVMLGLLVFPSQLLPVAGVALAIAAFLIFVARPLAVLVCYGPFRPAKKELIYVSWVGLRGSVPIVLATFPATSGIENSGQIFHLIFFVVITSVLVQGATLVKSAKSLSVIEE